MNRQELIDSIAAGASLSSTDAEAALEAFQNAVTSALSKGDKISLLNFCSFEPAKRNARTGRNPHTGAAINIPASTVVKFKAGKKLKDAVNG